MVEKITLSEAQKNSLANEVTTASITESFVDNPKAFVILAHGAGANMHHEFMENFSQLLNRLDINVLRFNFPYMDRRAQDGKKYPPNRMPQLLACYRAVVERRSGDLPLFIAGKSMGGRVAATLAAQADIDIKGVICIGYPFHPAKKPENLRLAPLQETLAPVLILQGDRDALGSKAEINDYDLSALCRVVYFEDGDHDLKPRVKSGFTHAQHLQRAALNIAHFVEQYV